MGPLTESRFPQTNRSPSNQARNSPSAVRFEGLRAYLCVCGGFNAPTILESQSGLEPVRVGELLTCPVSRIVKRLPVASLGKSSADPTIVRITPGLQRDWFEVSAFLGHIFTVSPASNRMGLRLVGPTLKVPMKEMTS